MFVKQRETGITFFPFLAGQPLPEKIVYGAHAMFAKKCVEPSETSLTPLVTVDGRTQNAEAMVMICL